MDCRNKGRGCTGYDRPYEVKVHHSEALNFIMNALSHGMWNDCFDREVECPRIEASLGITFPEGVYSK